MNIAMIVRNNLYSSPGGDSTQVDMTAKYLRLLGVNVDIIMSNKKINYSKYDILHFLNIFRPDDILPHINSSTPFVVSTVYVDYSEYDRKFRTGIPGLLLNIFGPNNFEYIKAIGRYIKNGDKIQSTYFLLNGQTRSIRKIASKTRILLPNSHSEYQRFSRDYLLECPYRKVVYAIDPSLFNPEIPENKNYKNHILCVGRIEGRKNQLNLIHALKDSDKQLTIIGKPSPNHIAYYDECKRLASESRNIQLVDQIDHEALAPIYKAAKVHVLPSWFETTGLSSLEGGVMGCNLVITDKGDTREYFEDLAFYCEPDSIESIRSAVYKAYDSPVNPALQKKIQQEYIWQNTATQTLDAYNFVLSNPQS